MYDVVLAACRWLEASSWAAMVRESAIAYPVMQWIHFVGLSVWLGACLSVDLRLMCGEAREPEIHGQRRHTAAELSHGLRAWKWIGFAVAGVGGLGLFSAYATMYVSNGWFFLKVAVLAPVALIWHLVVQKRAGRWTEGEHTSRLGRWAGVIEFVLWILVVTAAVGFLLTNVS